jgi:hypothetical protein
MQRNYPSGSGRQKLVVKKQNIAFISALLAAWGSLGCNAAMSADNAVINEAVTADACDERSADDDKQTAENRAVDKAGLAAVKLSGIIQKHYPDLSANALDIISYRIIDEYMSDSRHEVTLADGNRVCVNLHADVVMTGEQLEALVQEYRDSDAPEEQIEEVAKQVNEETAFKPRKLAEKRLLYIRKMVFWNGEETNHYQDLLTGLFSHSEYFFVTNDAKLADYEVVPRLLKAEVDEIDTEHHKMQMQVELDVFSDKVDDFLPENVKQTHFILFAADKDEQEIADDLLRKLLAKAAEEAGSKIDKFEAKSLENSSLHRK